MAVANSSPDALDLWPSLVRRLDRQQRQHPRPCPISSVLAEMDFLLERVCALIGQCMQPPKGSDTNADADDTDTVTSFVHLDKHLAHCLRLSPGRWAYKPVDTIPAEYRKWFGTQSQEEEGNSSPSGSESDPAEAAATVAAIFDFRLGGDQFVCNQRECGRRFDSFRQLRRHFERAHCSRRRRVRRRDDHRLKEHEGMIKEEWNACEEEEEEEGPFLDLVEEGDFSIEADEDDVELADEDEVVPSRTRRGRRPASYMDAVAVDRQYLCSFCRLDCHDQSSLRAHEQTHVKVGKHACDSCDFETTTAARLRSHRRREHPDADATAAAADSHFPCPEDACQKVFASRALLTQHASTHVRTRDCICEQCGKGFKNERYLASHLKLTHSDRRYLCVDCGKSYAQPSAYRSHRQHKHSERPPAKVPCQLCAKTFATKTTLKLHQALVHNAGDFKNVMQCDSCPRKFVSEAKMREHRMSKHLGVKYPCPHCGKEFNHKFSMTKHLRDKKCPVQQQQEQEEEQQ